MIKRRLVPVGPKVWTPRRAQRFCVPRLDRIKLLAQDIAYTWGDVNNSVVVACDDLLDALGQLKEAIDEATQHELERDEGEET